MVRKLIGVYTKSDNRPQLAKLFLSLAVIQLGRGDDVAAQAAVDEMAEKDGFASTEEFRAATELVEHYRSGDQDALIGLTQKQLFNFLEAEVRPLASFDDF